MYHYYFTDGILLLISTSELISAFSDLQVLIVNIYIPLNFWTVPCRWMKISASSPEGYESIPYMRYGHSASAIGDLVYIFGGRNDTYGACNTLFCFDTGNPFDWGPVYMEVGDSR